MKVIKQREQSAHNCCVEHILAGVRTSSCASADSLAMLGSPLTLRKLHWMRTTVFVVANSTVQCSPMSFWSTQTWPLWAHRWQWPCVLCVKTVWWHLDALLNWWPQPLAMQMTWLFGWPQCHPRGSSLRFSTPNQGPVETEWNNEQRKMHNK